VNVFFKIGSHALFAQGWLQTVIFLVSASWVARIRGMSYDHCPALAISWLFILPPNPLDLCLGLCYSYILLWRKLTSIQYSTKAETWCVFYFIQIFSVLGQSSTVYSTVHFHFPDSSCIAGWYD
jgi:hypothetical protein